MLASMPDMPYWLRKAKAELPPNQSNNHCTASHKAEMSAASNVQWFMFSGWCWIGDGEAGTELGKASATTHFGPHRGGGLMMTADLSTRRRHHPSLSLEFGVVGGRLASIQL